MKIKVEIIRSSQSWQQYKFITKSFVKKVVANIINRYNNLKITQELEIVILLTDDSQMLNLNQQFRGKDKTTNVLSFPDIVLDFRHLLEFTPDLHYMYLGDIAFGYETIIKEAISQNKTFKDHFTHLLVHSILHLLGFDHQNDEEAEIMEKLEAEILHCFAIGSPY
ncbi:rRNA maturation RNase YbeY [Candidatus Tisiphia endosymbiont of Beris chalybata]|uniref:rRNA maturation RNase YbeY n=1 Tax=Candidatus Tisiphia endosymbiont of Beris chalybata TaxID=3066262 RepID=UPI00312C842E